MSVTRIVGTPYGATVAGELVTIAARQYNPVTYADFTDASFLWNITQNEVSAIDTGGVTGVYGVQSDGTFDILGVSVSSQGWTTGDYICLAINNTIDQHATFIAAEAAGDASNSGDLIDVYYNFPTTGNSRYNVEIYTPAHGNISVRSGLPNSKVEIMFCNRRLFYGTQTSAMTSVDYSDLTFVVGQHEIVYSASAYAKATFSRCTFYNSGNQGSLNLAASHTIQFNFCAFLTTFDGINITGASITPYEFNNCIFTEPNSIVLMDFNSYPGVLNNCVLIYSPTAELRDMTNVVATNCIFSGNPSLHASSSGNIINADEQTLGFLAGIAGMQMNYRTAPDSSLLAAGVDVAGQEFDIDGNALVSGSVPIGISANSTLTYGVGVDYILDSISGGNYTGATVDKVLLNWQYGVSGTSLTGTLDPGSDPTAPTLSIVDNGDGTVTATVAGSDTGSTNTLYYAELTPNGTIGSTVTGDDRSEDGTIAQTVTGAPGYFLFWICSDVSTLMTESNHVVSSATTSGTIMEIEEAVYKMLSDSATVTAITTRIQSGSARQKAKMPYIVYTRITGTHSHEMQAAAGFVRVTIQIDSFAKTYAAVKELAEAVRTTLDGFRGNVVGSQGTIDIEGMSLKGHNDSENEPGAQGFNRVSMDFDIWARETIPTF